MRGYGFHKKLYARVEELAWKWNADRGVLREVCRRMILGLPWAELLPARETYW